MAEDPASSVTTDALGRLRSRLRRTAPSRVRHTTTVSGFSRRRTIAVWTCVVLATLVALVSSLTIWVKRQALDADAWASTSGQLLQDDGVRGALAAYLVTNLYDSVDVAQALGRRLPDGTKVLAAPAAAGIEQLMLRTANELLGHPRAQRLWQNANRRGVRALVAILDGKTVHGVRAQNGEVVLDLRPLVRTLETRAGIRKRLPPDAGRLVVLRANQLEAAQRGVRALRVFSAFGAIAVLALYAAAVWLSPGRRRRTLRAIGWNLVGVGMVLLVVRRIVGRYLVDALTSDQSVVPAANSAWLIGTNLLRDIAMALVIYGALLVAATWLAGPTRWATSIRHALAPIFRNRPTLAFGVVCLAFLLVILFEPGPRGRTLYGTLVLAGLGLVGTEVLRRRTLREFPLPRTGRPYDGGERTPGGPTS